MTPKVTKRASKQWIRPKPNSGNPSKQPTGTSSCQTRRLRQIIPAMIWHMGFCACELLFGDLSKAQTPRRSSKTGLVSCYISLTCFTDAARRIYLAHCKYPPIGKHLALLRSACRTYIRVAGYKFRNHRKKTSLETTTLPYWGSELQWRFTWEVRRTPSLHRFGSYK
jgi:hypothetical protein